MAKVLVPVRPGYEAQVLNFLETGKIETGVDISNLSAEYQAMLAELGIDRHDAYEQETALKADYLDTPNTTPTTDATTRTAAQPLIWEVRVPTTLVALCDGEKLCKDSLAAPALEDPIK